MGRKATGPALRWIAGLPVISTKPFVLFLAKPWATMGRKATGPALCRIAGLPVIVYNRLFFIRQTTGNCGTESHGSSLALDSRVASSNAKPWVTMGRKATGPALCRIAGPPVRFTEGRMKMKKLCFLMAAFIWASTLFFPQQGHAKLVAMSDQELNKITGQAGITIRAEDVIGLNIDAETLSWTPPGALDAQGNPMLISLANTTLDGWISSPNDIEIDFINGDNFAHDPRLIVGKNVAGVSIKMKDLEVGIDNFQTELKLGEGSLGIFGVQGFRAQFSGNVHIFTRLD
jgi:hypothetical protein